MVGDVERDLGVAPHVSDAVAAAAAESALAARAVELDERSRATELELQRIAQVLDASPAAPGPPGDSLLSSQLSASSLAPALSSNSASSSAFAAASLSALPDLQQPAPAPTSKPRGRSKQAQQAGGGALPPVSLAGGPSVARGRAPPPATPPQPRTERAKRLIASPATLIVCPTSLMHQWASELSRHAPGLRHATYHIVSNQYPDRLFCGPSDVGPLFAFSELDDNVFPVFAGADAGDAAGGMGAWAGHSSRTASAGGRPSSRSTAPQQQSQVPPEPSTTLGLPGFGTVHVYSCTLRELLAADVVITTYEVLAAQLHFSRPLKYRFRQTKKYRIPSSPLLQIHWHRCLLDEAQYIKNAVSSPTLMAARLSATHRWCVR